MAAVDRNNPQRAKSSGSTYTLLDFGRDFPDDTACLDYLWRRNYSADGTRAHCPKCERERGFARLRNHPAYACNSCGHHIHPLAGTIFHKSSTSLVLWFHAIFLMSQTRCGISAKQLERELGVTYKTAWRMFNKIRSLLSDDDDDSPLTGEVEVDETAHGGKPTASDTRAGIAYIKRSRRPTIFAAVERGGRVRARVIGGRTTGHLQEQMERHVDQSAVIYTDDWRGYDAIGAAYSDHKRINHTSRVYVEGSTHTNTVEGFFGLFKASVRGVYHGVSTKYLQNYLDEWTWRYNRRQFGTPLFQLMLDLAAGSRA